MPPLVGEQCFLRRAVVSHPFRHLPAFVNIHGFSAAAFADFNGLCPQNRRGLNLPHSRDHPIQVFPFFIELLNDVIDSHTYISVGLHLRCWYSRGKIVTIAGTALGAFLTMR
jgi:hypothetical protein